MYICIYLYIYIAHYLSPIGYWLLVSAPRFIQPCCSKLRTAFTDENDAWTKLGLIANGNGHTRPMHGLWEVCRSLPTAPTMDGRNHLFRFFNSDPSRDMVAHAWATANAAQPNSSNTLVWAAPKGPPRGEGAGGGGEMRSQRGRGGGVKGDYSQRRQGEGERWAAVGSQTRLTNWVCGESLARLDKNKHKMGFTQTQCTSKYTSIYIYIHMYL